MDEIEKSLIDQLHKKPEIVSVYLFGSQAKGNQGKDSDIDIAILFDWENVPDQLELIEIREELSQILNNDVDLVCLNGSSPIIGMQVLKYGKLLFTNDPKKKLQL